MEEETQMTSPGILLCAVCCSYLIPESSSASPRHRCALKNKSFTAKLAALRTYEWNTEPELYSRHKFLFLLKEQPLYAFVMGNLTEEVSLSSFSISNFPSTEISENSKKIPRILLTLSSGSLLLKLKFVF